MITRKDIFAKRKEGALDEAYRMALELMASPNADEWDRKEFCWCLINLIKRDANTNKKENLQHYRLQLESTEVDPADEILSKGIQSALSLFNPGGNEIREAKSLSWAGKHAEAVVAFKKALEVGACDKDTHNRYAWSLYNHSKELLDSEPVKHLAVRRNLKEYLELDVEKPSQLHSRFLQLANKLASDDKLSMLAFSRLWNLKYLRTDDYKRYRADDGKEYPSLAEKVIQQAGKEAAHSENSREQEYILPHLDAAIDTFPDNVWLKLDKAKTLNALRLHKDALAFGLVVAKAKSNDYWAWALLGDSISLTNPTTAFACYCKALTCHAEDKFTGKIRLRVAKHMLEISDFSAAKFEIESIVRSKESEGHKIPGSVAALASQPWFAQTKAKASNQDFYRTHTPVAEALLFNDLPWINANIGDKFTVTEKDGKQRQKRKIFLDSSFVPTEESINESQLKGKKLTLGDAIRVKGEFDDKQRFKIFVFEIRETEQRWDVLHERIGVVDHINNEKGVLHFIVERGIDGVIPIKDLTETFSEGDSIAVKLSKYTSKQGSAFRVHQANATEKEPSSNIKKQFIEEVRVSNGMGFTDNKIFVPPPLISGHRIEDGQKVSGTAVLGYNKKYNNWGWKAVEIYSELNQINQPVMASFESI